MNADQNTGITVSRANIADAAAIADCHVRCWRESYKLLMPAAMLSELSVEKRTQHWSECISRIAAEPHACAGEFVIVAKHSSDGIIGFASGGAMRGEASDYGEASACGEVYAIYVLNKYHQKGIGHELWKNASYCLRAGNYTKGLVWVLSGNQKAQTFYERQHCLRTTKTKTASVGDVLLEEIAYEWNIEYSVFSVKVTTF